VKKQLQNIEDFVRGKLALLEGDSQPDWLSFEGKLQKATRRRKIKRASEVLGLIMLLGFSQTFLSGDWPLHKTEYDAALEINEKEGPKTSLADVSLWSTPNNNQALKVVYLTSNRPNSKEPNTLLSLNLSAKSTNKDMAIPAEKDVLEEQPKSIRLASNSRTNNSSSPALQVAGASLDEPRNIIVLPQLEKPAKLIDLPKGNFIVDGSITGESQFPFDVVIRDLDLHESFMKMREAGYVKSLESKGPYISPLQEKKDWSYSLNIYPNFAFRELKIDRRKRALLHSDFIDAMLESERSGMNLNLGFELSKRVGPITYFNTGIEYINNSFNAQFDFLNFREANFDQRGEIIDYTLLRDPKRITFSNVNSFHYLNIPASISYQPWANDHLRINLEFGFSLLYFLRADGETIDYRTLDIVDLADRDYRKYMGSSSLKIGVQYYVSPNMNIGLEPTFMYFSNSIYTEDHPFEVIPYSVGLNLNLQMKLQ
jgi:hypothetical protein